MFPVGDTNVRGARFPWVNWVFIAINVLVFLYEATLSPAALERFIFTYGAVPANILDGDALATLVTSMFMHGGWAHLIGNMLFLYVCGDNVEAVMGHIGYFLFYMAGGVAASAMHIVLSSGSEVPSVGASGAISAVLGAYLVMFPGSRIRLLMPFGGLMRMTTVSALMFLGLWAVQQFISGIASLAVQTAQTGGVAWWAHIGGFLFGLVVGFVFRGRASASNLEAA